MADNTFSAVFNSDMLEIKYIVDDALNHLRCLFPEISAEDFFDFKLIISELLANAVIHGNDSDCGKKVFLNIKAVEGNTVQLHVIDEGIGFDVDSYVKMPVDNAKLMSESGRGVKIVNSLVDEIICSSSGNEIKIYKKVVSHEP